MMQKLQEQPAITSPSLKNKAKQSWGCPQEVDTSMALCVETGGRLSKHNEAQNCSDS
jgi:hypothetical protein